MIWEHNSSSRFKFWHKLLPEWWQSWYQRQEQVEGVQPFNENIAPSTALQDNLVAEPERVEKTSSSPEQLVAWLDISCLWEVQVHSPSSESVRSGISQVMVRFSKLQMFLF